MGEHDKKKEGVDGQLAMVNYISQILWEHRIVAKIDFDHRDGIVIIKYKCKDEQKEITYIIDSNNRLISGIDNSKMWMPDYYDSQKIDRKVLRFLESRGFSLT